MSIEGIGEKKAAALIKELKTVSKIKAASVKELSEVRGISRKDAERIYEYFNSEKNGK